jgi:HlyD family secretion protein
VTATVKKLLFGVLLFVALVATGCWWFASHGAAPDGDGYTFVAVEYGRATEVVSATGTVRPRDVYQVGTELSGKVVEVCADFNQTVEEGQLLLRLDDRDAKLRLRQAELGVSQAEAAVHQAEAGADAAAKAEENERQRSPEVRRQIELDLAVSRRRGADAAVEVARIQLRQAEESRVQADDALRRTEIRAPLLADGPTADARGPGLGAVTADAASRTKRTFIVLDRKASLNQTIGPPASSALFTLAEDMSRMRVETQVVEGDVHKITRGSSVEFKASNADDEMVFHGRVEEVRQTPVSDRGAVFYNVIIDAENRRDLATNEWRLRPGLTATVDVLLRAHEAAWKLPTVALSFQMDPALETDAARAKLARWREMKDRDSWRPIWVIGADNRTEPVLVRTGGRGADGQTGVQDSQFTEVLQWDGDLKPPPTQGEPATYPRPIIGLPPAKHGWFNAPKIKL